LKLLSAVLSLTLLATIGVRATTLVEDDYELEISRRLNAHGDEFMSIALTSDASRLIIGTESGKIIVWDIKERRVLKKLDQGSPVHCVVELGNADEFVAAGGPHAGRTQSPSVRKWRISSGTSEEWQGLSGGTILSLASDPRSGLVAAGTATGQLAVWNSSDGSVLLKNSFDALITGVAVNGREVYLTTFQSDDGDQALPNTIQRLFVDSPNKHPLNLIPKNNERAWMGLEVSPQGRYVAATFLNNSKPGIALLDLSNGSEISTFEANFAAWSAKGTLILFDQEVAVESVTISDRGEATHSELFKSASWHQAGAPAHMSGRVVSADGSRAWEVFQLGATLVELDLQSKQFDELHRIKGYLYALDVDEATNLLATGGDDGYIRVRRLSDLSLLKEFQVTTGVPQGVGLMNDGRHVVFSASTKDSPTRISIGDLSTGRADVLFDVPQPFVDVEAVADGFLYNQGNRLILSNKTGGKVREYVIDGKLDRFALSSNDEWLVVSNADGKLFRFEIKTGRRISVGARKVDTLTSLTISNSGRFVFTTEFNADLKRWDTNTNKATDLASIRGQAQTLKLSRDEKEIAVGGNHRDVAVYEIASGERRLYLQMSSADFYVTTVWLAGDRMLFSTDAGVLFDGTIKR
jgi:WD40 repeat protein